MKGFNLRSLAAVALLVAMTVGAPSAAAHRKGTAMQDHPCDNPFVPRWKVGDSWSVEYAFPEPNEAFGPSRLDVKQIWSYRVADVHEREDAYELVASSKLPFAYHLFIRRSDFTLVRFFQVERGKSIETTNPLPGAAFMRVKHVESMLFDLGSFCRDTTSGTRTFTAPNEPTITQKLMFDPATSSMKVVLAADAWKKDLVSEQTWKSGLPWWSEARKTLGQDVIVTGTLLKP